MKNVLLRPVGLCALLLALGLIAPPSARAAAPASASTQSAQEGGDKKDEKKRDGPVLPPGVGKDEGPRLDYAVGSQNHNFGKLMQGAIAKHTFELHARGTEPLKITNVKPTCGCTVAQVLVEDDKGSMVAYTYNEPIPLGRRIQVPAELHTKGKFGHQNTRINIFSTDTRGSIQLGLEAEIQAFLDVTPRYLNFGNMKLGETQTQRAVVATSAGELVRMSLADTGIGTGVKTQLEPINPDAEGRAARWQVTVTVGPDLVEGNFARTLVLQSDYEMPKDDHDPNDGQDHTGHSHAPTELFHQTMLSLSATVVGPFTFTPNYISMGLVRPGQVISRSIRIDSNDPEHRFADKLPVGKIVGMPVPGGEGYQEWNLAKHFSFIVRPVEGANSVDIELRLEGLPEEASGSFRGTLLIELGHPDKPEITLTITGVCRGGPVTPRPGGQGAGQ